VAIIFSSLASKLVEMFLPVWPQKLVVDDFSVSASKSAAII
jgi:hypothetical protein